MDYEIPFAQSQYLYKCNSDGTGVSMQKTCSACEKASPSRCKRNACRAGENYCGVELHALSWDESWFLSDSLYKCDLATTSAILLATCTKCTTGTPSHCLCKPSTMYCGRDLAEKLYWKISDEGLRSIGECSASGLTVAWSRICSRGCSSGSPGAMPTCTIDPCYNRGALYCGHELLAKDWPSDKYSATWLYKCLSDGVSASKGQLRFVKLSSIGMNYKWRLPVIAAFQEC